MSRVVSQAPSRRRLRGLSAVFVALGLLAAPACSSGSDSSDGKADTVEVSGKTDAGDSSSAEGEVPDAFPDVPLPEYTEVETIKEGEPDGRFWQLMFIVDPSMQTDGDEIVSDYSAQLEADGFDVDASGPAASATKGDLELSYHSSASGSISIAVIGV